MSTLPSSAFGSSFSPLNFAELNQPSSINTGLTSPLLGNLPISNDTFASAAASLGLSPSLGSGNALNQIKADDQIFYNSQDGRLYVRRQTPNGQIILPLNNSNILFTSNPNLTDQQKYNLRAGDQLFYDISNGKIYIKREGINGPEYIDLNGSDGQVDNTPNDTTSSIEKPKSVPVDVQKEVNRISSRGKTFEALNIPHGLNTAPVDVNGVFPGFGDRTGASTAASLYTEAGLYTQLQKTLSIINYLNTAPAGTSPNPNFSYISGRPPYAQDTPEGRRAQDQVFAMLRTNIIAQLTRIAEQLRDAVNGLRQQRDLAENHKRTQDGDVKKFVDAAFAGGGGGGGG